MATSPRVPPLCCSVGGALDPPTLTPSGSSRLDEREGRREGERRREGGRGRVREGGRGRGKGEEEREGRGRERETERERESTCSETIICI